MKSNRRDLKELQEAGNAVGPDVTACASANFADDTGNMYILRQVIRLLL